MEAGARIWPSEEELEVELPPKEDDKAYTFILFFWENEKWNKSYL